MSVSAGRSRVLLIPGLDGHPGLLLAAAPTLFAVPGLRVLGFNHQSTLADGGVEGLAERALAELEADQDGDAPAYVCGESFGGTIALTLARRYPQRVRGLLLFSTFGRYPVLGCRGGEAGLALWRLLGDPLAGHLIRASRPLGVPGALGWRFSREALRTYLEHPRADPSVYRTKCEASVRFDARPWLGSVRCPAFVLTGSWDPIVPVSATVELARMLPHARLHRLRGGHALYLVRAAEVGQLVSEWMATPTAPEPPRT